MNMRIPRAPQLSLSLPDFILRYCSHFVAAYAISQVNEGQVPSVVRFVDQCLQEQINRCDLQAQTASITLVPAGISVAKGAMLSSAPPRSRSKAADWQKCGCSIASNLQKVLEPLIKEVEFALRKLHAASRWKSMPACCFRPGQAELQPSSIYALEQVGSQLSLAQVDNLILVEGIPTRYRSIPSIFLPTGVVRSAASSVVRLFG